MQQSLPLQNEVIPTSETTFCPVAKPLSTMPAPPVPRVFESYHSISTARRHSEPEINSSSVNEILNPNVPEFVPTTENTNGFTATNESNQTKNKFHFEKIKETLAIAEMFLIPPNNNNSPTKIKEDNKLPAISDSLSERLNGESDSSSDSAWKEVSVILFLLYQTIRFYEDENNLGFMETNYLQVRRRVKQHKDRSEEKDKSEIVKNAVREELDFQFDEELDSPPPTGRHNAFSEWSVESF